MTLNDLRYRLFGRRIRAKACHYAALALSGRRDGEGITPQAWSLAVFFEMYILDGCDATKDDFGPKEPAELKIVER